jgi:hypothetical protein
VCRQNDRIHGVNKWLMLFVLATFTIPARTQIVNPGFDDGVIVPIFEPDTVKPTEALPGWTASKGGTPLVFLFYNETALDSPWVSIHDNSDNFELFRPIDGKYSVFIKGATPSAPELDASLSQIVNVPSTAKSVLFYARNLNGLELSFSGQKLPYFEVYRNPPTRFMALIFLPFPGSMGSSNLRPAKANGD